MLIGICGGKTSDTLCTISLTHNHPRHLRRQELCPGLSRLQACLSSPLPRFQHHTIILRRQEIPIIITITTTILPNNRSSPQPRHLQLATKLRNNLHPLRKHSRKALHPPLLHTPAYRRPNLHPLGSLPTEVPFAIPPQILSRTIRPPTRREPLLRNLGSCPPRLSRKDQTPKLHLLPPNPPLRPRRPQPPRPLPPPSNLGPILHDPSLPRRPQKQLHAPPSRLRPSPQQPHPLHRL